MYIGIATQKSCATAWVAAASAIIDNGDEGYNVVIDVADPVTHDDEDNKVITLVDKFLKAARSISDHHRREHDFPTVALREVRLA